MIEHAVDIWFCATARSGLGHLMRCHTIARALAARRPDLRIGMMTNAPTIAFEDPSETVFAEHMIVERDAMAAALQARPARLMVADTLIMPGIDTLSMRRALILREMPEQRIPDFSCGSRAWDLVLIPNPPLAWQPTIPPTFAERILHVGWIYRPTPIVPRDPARTPMALVTFGGGGNAATRQALRERIEPVLAAARNLSERDFEVFQVLGPRASEDDRLLGCDHVIEVGGALNQWLSKADVVITTVGYNTILELAQTDVPAMLVPIARNIDDQDRRARHWQARLGHRHVVGEHEHSARWLAEQLARRERRAPVDLGPSGEGAAAAGLERCLATP
ncbi:MAG: glycosyltransferase [Burkholderiaceae bacterium]